MSRRHSMADGPIANQRGLKAFLGRIVLHDPWHFPQWRPRSKANKAQDERVLRPPPSFSALMEERHLAAVLSQASPSRHPPRGDTELRHSSIPLVPSGLPPPAIRKGSEGKWIAPTLTQGSLSTTALEKYATFDETLCGPADQKAGSGKGSGKPRKSSLSVMFTGSGFTNHSIDEEDTNIAAKVGSTPEGVSGLPNSSFGRQTMLTRTTTKAPSSIRARDVVSMPPPPLPHRNMSSSPTLQKKQTILQTTPPDQTGDSEREMDISLREEYQLRGRRMSERTLHDARQRIMGQLSQHSGSLDHLGETPSESNRREALSQSLATLEGRRQSRAQLQPGIVPKKPIPVRSPSVASSHTTLEDQPILAPSGSGLLRRTSANSGKILVPKRALSPPSSSTTRFPIGQIPQLAPAPLLVRSRTTSAFLERPPTSMLERRQSEGYPAQHESPVQLRLQSMVNLSSCSPLESLSRGDSRIPEGSPRILSFGEGLGLVRYQLGNCIGRGQFGSVYRSLNLAAGQMVAIKRISLAGMTDGEVREVMREVELLQRLRHPSIVRYEGMSRDEDYLNIVLEFVENGSLGQTLKAFGSFNEKLVASYVWKILEGLQYLHSSGVVHCDLKAANILSTKNGNIKLSDFGVSLNLRAVEHIKANATIISRKGVKAGVSEIAGTPNWSELGGNVIADKSGARGDLANGRIARLGHLVVGMYDHRTHHWQTTLCGHNKWNERIVEDDMPPLPPTSPPLNDFLQRCFTKSPKRRPTAQQLFQHPWLADQAPDLDGKRALDSVPFHVRTPRLPKSQLPTRSTSLASIADLPPLLMSRAPEGGKEGKRISLHEKLLRGFKLKRVQ